MKHKGKELTGEMMATKMDWTPEKEALLLEQEEIIESGRVAFDKTLKALATIHHEKLYLKTHANFGAYCEERFGFGQRWAERIISLVGLNAKLELLANPGSHPQVQEGVKLIQRSGIKVQEVIKDLPTKRLKTVVKEVGKTGEIPTAKELKVIVPEDDEEIPVPVSKCPKCGKKVSGPTKDWVQNLVCMCENKTEVQALKAKPTAAPTPNNHPVLIAMDNEWVNIQRGLAYGDIKPVQIYQRLRAAAEKAIVTI